MVGYCLQTAQEATLGFGALSRSKAFGNVELHVAYGPTRLLECTLVPLAKQQRAAVVFLQMFLLGIAIRVAGLISFAILFCQHRGQAAFREGNYCGRASAKKHTHAGARPARGDTHVCLLHDPLPVSCRGVSVDSRDERWLAQRARITEPRAVLAIGEVGRAALVAEQSGGSAR